MSIETVPRPYATQVPNRCVRVQTYFTKENAAQIKNAAERAGVSLSEFIRRAALLMAEEYR